MKTKIVNGVSLFLLTFLSLIFLLIYVPKVFGLNVYYVETQSMSPTINVGDSVFVKATSFEEISQNDVITFKNETGTKFCTHRVIEVNEKGKSFVTKGDHNSVRDPFETEYKYVVGKVVFKLPAVGFLFNLLNTNAARIIVVILAIVFASIEIEIYKNHKKRGRQK